MKPIAYVINLDRRRDRWERARELWSPYFNLVRYPAIEAFNGKTTNGALGCKLSHLYLAEQYLRKDRVITVLEDDAEPTEWFEKIGLSCLFDAMFRFTNWDYINLGPFLDLATLNLPCATLSESSSELFYRTTYSHNTHMVVYSDKSLKLMKSSLKNSLPIDMYFGRYAKEQWVPIHVLATQYESKSDVSTPKISPRLLYERSEQLLTEHLKTRNSQFMNAEVPKPVPPPLPTPKPRPVPQPKP